MSLLPLDLNSQLLEKLTKVIGTPNSSPPEGGIVLLGYDGSYVRRVKTTSDGKLVLWLG